MSRKILIVDDSSTMRNIVKKELHDINCELVEAVNGKDALEKLMSISVDLVLMDGFMPDMNGYETYEKI